MYSYVGHISNSQCKFILGESAKMFGRFAQDSNKFCFPYTTEYRFYHLRVHACSIIDTRMIRNKIVSLRTSLGKTMIHYILQLLHLKRPYKFMPKANMTRREFMLWQNLDFYLLIFYSFILSLCCPFRGESSFQKRRVQAYFFAFFTQFWRMSAFP